MSALPYPRDLRGYGRQPPHARWPGQAGVAVQFVLNYEEGGENNPLHGDPTSETFLSELVTAQAYENRHMTMESTYEYGSRVGVWRILKEFDQRGLPLTVFGVVSAPERFPELVAHFMARGDETANHGLRWIHHQHMPEATERKHIRVASELLQSLTGGVAPHLVVPYSLDNNDMRYVQAQGFNTGEHFFTCLRDSFNALYAEGDEAPRMMSIGMHCRLLGEPGRIGSLQRFLDHIGRHERVWICRRIDIARHWKAVHPFDAATAFTWPIVAVNS